MWVWFPEGQEGLIGSLRRATVQKIDDSGTQQILKKMTGLKTEIFEDVYRPQPHGFSSHPPSGSEGLYLALGGRSDRLLGLGFEHKDFRYRNLPEGQAVLYDHKGNVVLMQSDKGVRVAAKKGVVEVSAQDSKVFVKPGAGQMVFLGGDGEDGSYGFVETDVGTSINVKAKVG
ncbi:MULTISPECIES: phage baseplate assembly protein [unclassified Bradyrhizobium]|uniref:phage baseplate assembly protein domain-containing protein n=1 Tax=unclassified Bradyrhizobium TaxID=2631580 RepID=UPI002915FB4E|nr:MULTISPECIES: phage baseplate assembly protein [unclassified Bradyrhizobium]